LLNGCIVEWLNGCIAELLYGFIVELLVGFVVELLNTMLSLRVCATQWSFRSNLK